MTCHEILIVEDDEDIRDVLRGLLEIEGFRVSTAENGRQGLQRLAQMKVPCLILLDLLTPVKSGAEFLDMLSTQHGHVLATIPVDVVPAMAELAGVAGEGDCPMMKKPIDLERLVTLAHEHCLAVD